MPDGKRSGWLAGTTRKRTFSAHFLAMIMKLTLKSLIRPLLQEPKNASVITNSTNFFCRNFHYPQNRFAATGRTLDKSRYILLHMHLDHSYPSLWLSAMCFSVLMPFHPPQKYCFCTCLYCHIAKYHTLTDA